jgi:hypothetical protein
MIRKTFRRRYRMSKKIIKNEVRAYDEYFTAKPNAIAKFGFTSYQKYYAAIRMPAYGFIGDLVDEYLQMSETTFLSRRTTSVKR